MMTNRTTLPFDHGVLPAARIYGRRVVVLVTAVVAMNVLGFSFALWRWTAVIFVGAGLLTILVIAARYLLSHESGSAGRRETTWEPPHAVVSDLPAVDRPWTDTEVIPRLVGARFQAVSAAPDSEVQDVVDSVRATLREESGGVEVEAVHKLFGASTGEVLATLQRNPKRQKVQLPDEHVIDLRDPARERKNA